MKDTAVVVFRYVSRNGEGGFPGNLLVRVAYKLTERNEIVLEYEATTDRPTVVNLTNHSYFNLAGCRKPVTGHLFRIASDSVTVTDSEGIPTGGLLAVRGTHYDFSALRGVANWLTPQNRGTT